MILFVVVFMSLLSAKTLQYLNSSVGSGMAVASLFDAQALQLFEKTEVYKRLRTIELIHTTLPVCSPPIYMKPFIV